jgi:hypothetical protein
MRKNRMISLLPLHLASLRTSVENQPENNPQKHSYLHFSRKIRSLIAIGIIAIILVSAFVFMLKAVDSNNPSAPQSSDSPTAFPSSGATNKPTQVANSPSPTQIRPTHQTHPTSVTVKDPGIISTAQTIDNTTWRKIAEKAWSYFQIGVGLDGSTGLPYAGGVDFQAFTDWDLGVYIQAIIDAQKIGLIGTDGDLGSYDRSNKVLAFLETRDLNATTRNPYWFYYSSTGQRDLFMPDTGNLDLVDTGRLFVALNNLKAYNSNWTQRINNIVYNQVENQVGNRTNYAASVSQIKNAGFSSNSIYAYYIYSGFESFWPNDLRGVTNAIMKNIVSSGRVITYNVSLPNSVLTCDPLLCSFFELNNSSSDLAYLLRQVYLAHEANYNTTGNYVAFSEGGSGTSDFLYEWVVAPDGSTWKIQTLDQLGTVSYSNIDPVIYTKVAFSFLALYNSSYAKNMVVYLEQALSDPSNGYRDGADNAGKTVSGIGSNTNGLILDAALYFIQNHPS